MRISVITCTLDAAPWLIDNILSVATQNYVDVEQVFVDGGSTDGTLELIAKAPHRTVLVENVRGLSAAMNAGVEAASGDIVMHLHGDDYLAGKDALARVAAAFERFGCGWLYGQCRSDFGEGRFLERRAPRWSARRLRTRGNFVAHPAVAIRRELFLETGGFDTSLRCCMDYDLWLRLSRISRPRVIDDFIATFRYHDAAITSRFTDVCLREDRELRLRYAQGALERAIARACLWRTEQRLRRLGKLACGACGA
jgi:glycosyltransferase involved in cell wall biosynthesis